MSAAKKLTMEQLRSIGIFNPYEFAGTNSYGFYLQHIGYTRQTMASFGWWLSSRCLKGISDFKPGVRLFDMRDGRANPSDNRAIIEPVLHAHGLEWPEDGWIKFMGVWWPLGFYGQRMAHLVTEYKETLK